MNLLTLFLFLLGAIRASCEAHGDPDLERTRLHTEMLWRRSSHLMATVGFNKASVGNILAPLFGYQFLLPMPQLRAGLAYSGAKTRLRRFVRDLLMGKKSIKIGAVGGSVTWGQGTSNSSEFAWFNVLGRWLVDGFPGVNVTARNGAVPATPASYMVMCADLYVDPDVDLLFVEYQINNGVEDKVFDNRLVRIMERLLRRLLALPGAPAVVLMQVPSFGMARDRTKRPFYETMEDLEGALAQYYDVQYLSVRTALYRLAVFERTPRFHFGDLFYDQHPGDAGNRVMADLAAFLIQQTALELLLEEPFGQEDERRLAQPLPDPMHKGNAPPNSPMCLHGPIFQSLVTTANGFTYVNEGSDVKPRWGYVANTTGSRLVVQFSTLRSDMDPGQKVSVFVQHLKSYEHMGVATINCTSGCMCAPVEVDGHIPDLVSQTYQAKLLVSQSDVCEVAVEVLPRTGSGEHKFKVVGLVVADTPISAGVLDQMADTAGQLPAHLAPTTEVITRRRRQ